MAIPVLLALAVLTLQASAASITITNADFEADFGGDWTFIPDWTEEGAGGANSWIESGSSWKPDSDQDLYFNSGGAINQNLNHYWSSTDTFTLTLTGQNTGWNGGAAAIKVQLCETDGRVLWDSGDLDVAGTVDTGTKLYTGTGHLHNLNIEGSNFVDVAYTLEGSQINIRLVGSAGSTFLDDVTLDVSSDPNILLLGRTVPTNAPPGTLVGTLIMVGGTATHFALTNAPAAGSAADNDKFQITEGTNLRTRVLMSQYSNDVSIAAVSNSTALLTNSFPITLTRAVAPASAETISITNADFEADYGGDWTFIPNWTEEAGGAGSWIANAADSWKPDSDQELYLSGAINQTLNHNWSSTDTFYLGLTGQNAGWVGGAAAIKVQLREADGTVLWDSGDLDVAGTVETSTMLYTGTGHLHGWQIEGSSFEGVGGAVEGSQINVRLVGSVSSTYLDDIVLMYTTPAAGTIFIFE